MRNAFFAGVSPPPVPIFSLWIIFYGFRIKFFVGIRFSRLGAFAAPPGRWSEASVTVASVAVTVNGRL